MSLRWQIVAAGVALAVVLPVAYHYFMKHLPLIHDISTDTDDPPAFVAVLPLRKDAPNTAAYGGAEVAAHQRRAYPDIRPLDIAASPAEAMRRAEQVARDMGWEIVALVASEGRLEATARTRWLGFADDVVVRVRPRDGGSRIDVRSVSRLGRGDLGTNAKRVRDYLGRLAETS